MNMQLPVLHAACERAMRAGLRLTLVCVNVRGFRALNRQFGSARADEVLRVLGRRFAGVEDVAAVARLPGDEFVIALHAGPASPQLARALRDIERRAALPFDWLDAKVTLSVSLGVASAGRDGATFPQLFDHAEAAMVEARARTRPQHADSRQPALAPGLASAADALRGALARREFVLHYQPQVDLHSGAVTGAEALIRWNHPQHGLLSPGEFVEAAEQTGVIVEIGRWALQEACREAARWRASGHEDMMVAVNLSARQFDAGGLDAIVQEALDGAALPASCLELELTETILIHDTDNVLAQIRQLKQMGLALSLDDFGTGYSSLSYLKKFAVDKIKIDRSFVSGLDKDGNDAAIVRAIVQIARSLGLATIAEGVESKSQLGSLQLLGCDEVQGYYFSPPLPAAAFAKMLAVLRRAHVPHLKERNIAPVTLFH